MLTVTLMSTRTSQPGVNRRQFLRATAATTAVAAASRPASTFAQATRPTARVEVAVMGLNSRGMDLLKEFLAQPQVVVTWLCDVDQRALDKAAQLVREKQTLAVKTSPDIRRVLEDRRLQAVVIAAPDHWHAPAAILAVQAGKHVYVEKPLTHNPREGEWLIEAVRRARTVVQVGLQRRSTPWVQEAIRRVQSGELGEVPFARAWYANRRPGIGFGQLAPVPDWLNFDLWQGPAPERPFRDNYVHYHWHWFWHWGTGELGNNGVHFLDLIRWGLQLDCPTRVTSGGGRHYFDDDQETPDTQVVTYDFGKQTVVWEHRSCDPQPLEGEAAGIAFHGQRSTLILGGRGFRVVDPDGKETFRMDGGVPSAPHVANFLDCITNPGRTPAATADDGHLSTLWCHLGNIAHRTRQTLELNPATRQPRANREAAKLWSREYRPGWQPKV